MNRPVPPRVAVLLSTYNGERFLAAQIDSLAAQHDVDVTVFARDDGSSDSTVAILTRYAAVWPRLRTTTGENLGPVGGFLELLRLAPDDFAYYAFCDQDDVWLPHKLARATERLAGHSPSLPGLYCSGVTYVDHDLRPFRAGGPRPDTRFEHLLFENFAFGNTVVMNAEARARVTANMPRAGVIMHDWWCALVVAATGVIEFDDRPGVLYRQHGKNVVGAARSRIGEVFRQARLFCTNPRRFYPIHAQATEFMRLFADHLDAERRGSVAAVVDSRRSLRARARLAFSWRVVRARRFDATIVRALILLGWY